MKSKNQSGIMRLTTGNYAGIFCTLLVSSLLGLSATSASAAATPAMTGDWAIHSSISGNESDMTCSFVQTGKDLTGTCKPDPAKDPIKITGSVDGSKIAFKYTGDYNGTPLTMSYSATVDDPVKIAGAVDVQPFDVSGEFTAVPAKPAAK